MSSTREVLKKVSYFYMKQAVFVRFFRAFQAVYCKTKINKNFRQTFYENKNKSKNFYMRDLRNMIQSLSKEISRYLT